jgi:hypothetical protein
MAANVDRVTDSNSSPEAKVNAKNPHSSAPKPELAPKVGAAAGDSRQVEA